MIKKTVLRIYYFMQCHYVTFRMWIWLKEHGITERFKPLLRLKARGNNVLSCSVSQMKNSQNFFYKNQDRVNAMFSLLADEQSRKVMRSVIECRTSGAPIPKGLYTENDQYFVEGIVKLDREEVFVDGGAYVGDTIQRFMNVAKRQGKVWKHIIAFEPKGENFKVLRKFFGQRGVHLINKGLSAQKDILYFSYQGSGSKFVAKEKDATTKVDVINIDVVPECQDATFIKMDVEGSEIDALRGAKETIIRNHPKLAICIYHSDDDMIRIAEYIHQLVPEYRLYVRHHSGSSIQETVLYAVL